MSDSDRSSARARAEAAFLDRHLRDVQSAARLSNAEARERAMEEKTARLRALRLARDAGSPASGG